MKKHFNLFIIWGLLLIISIPSAHAQRNISKVQSREGSSLENDFLNPPVSARPYVWWHWLGSNFSKEGITKDLEAMKSAGVGGATIFNISSSVVESHLPTLNNPWPDQTYRSPKYWEAVRYAASEAKRLGLELGLHNTVGYSTTGGPWIDEQRSMQHVVWSETAIDGGVKTAIKLAIPVVTTDEGWGKTGRKMSWFKDFAVLAVPADKTTIKLTEVLDITSKMDTNGNLNWIAPAGKWLVYRLAHASTGRPPHPVPDDVLGKVLEADKISMKQTKYHWNQVIEPMKKNLGPLLGSGMKHFLIDSYEAGFQNWSSTFRKDFKQMKGYDPLPWLMTFNTTVLNGKKPVIPKDTIYPQPRIVESQELSTRFESDYRDVISQLYYQNGWKPASDMIHAVGMTLQQEAYGGPFSTVQGSALADVPMCEFWSGRKTFVNPVVAGASRAAGKTVIGAEALTGSPTYSKWTEVPSFLKPTLDGGYAGGVNRMVLHHWVHQPFDDKYQPGLGMGWWGTHFNRHQTWFEPGKAFFLYMARVQAMLQKGETTIYTLSVGGSSSSTDIITADMLLKDVRVENGKIALPSGRRYFVLEIPHDGRLLPEVVTKIEKLLKEGATIVASKPTASPSLTDYPACDKKVKEIAKRIWGESNDSVRKIGKGTLYTEGSAQGLQKALDALGCVKLATLSTSNPDIRVLQRTNGKESWYFVANTGDKTEQFSVSFSANNQLPEIWDAETGTIVTAPEWRKAGIITEVDLTLPEHKSLFVVFRKSIPVGMDQLVGVDVDSPAGYDLISSQNGIVLLESAKSMIGTLRFASGKTKQFELKSIDTIKVKGPWDVRFKTPVTKDFTEQLPKLESLALNTNKDIKYFSGTATYKINVDMPASSFKSGQRFQLDLGEVYDMATVTINGKSQGVWWNPPFTGDITDALKAGSNTIEIAVTNSWHNLLVGDEQYPADFEWGADRGVSGRMMKGYPDWFLKNQPRPQQNRKGFVVWYYHRQDTPLKPSGLVGPVSIVPKSTVTAIP
jgi:hypothetical protein